MSNSVGNHFTNADAFEEWRYPVIFSRANSHAAATPLWTPPNKWFVWIRMGWRTKSFACSFYPDSVICWNELGPEIRKSETLSIFKSNYIKTIRPIRSSIFDIHNPDALRYIYQLRVDLSPLKAHKKRHGFTDTHRTYSMTFWQRLWDYIAFLIRLPLPVHTQREGIH